MKTIKVTVSPEGEVKIETSGFQGGACESETRDLERALGGASKNTRTREYYASAAVQEVKAR